MAELILLPTFLSIFNPGSQALYQVNILRKKRLYVIKSPERNADYERPLQGAENAAENTASVYFLQNLQAFFAYFYVFSSIKL